MALPTGSGAEGLIIVTPAAPTTEAKAAQGQPEPAAPPAAPVGEQQPAPRTSAAPGTGASDGLEPNTPTPTRTGPTGQGTGAPPDHQAKTPRPDLVTLNQAAGMVHKGKRTLEDWKEKGKLPAPAVKGGQGRADLWRWEELRPVLETLSGIVLPETFPANRVLP
jgi:hypothetical protein